MSKIIWDATGERFYKTGIDHCVLYPQVDGAYPKGYAWNGITSISEKPSGAEPTDLYADNIKYLSMRSAETFGLTIECYTMPDEWSECNGEGVPTKGIKVGQQKRNGFGLCYRSKVGNDTKQDDYGYELHLVYGATASPSEISLNTINDSPDANTFSYEVTTTPINVTGYRPTAILTISSVDVDSDKLAQLENILYGTDPISGEGGTDARLPLPDEIFTLFAAD